MKMCTWSRFCSQVELCVDWVLRRFQNKNEKNSVEVRWIENHGTVVIWLHGFHYFPNFIADMSDFDDNCNGELQSVNTKYF